MRPDRAILLRRLTLLGMIWAGTSVFFTAVLMVSDLGGHKPFGFALYSNGVHFALWTLVLPVIWRSAISFPLSGTKKIRNAAVLLLIVAALAALVASCLLAILYSTYYPYRSSSGSFRALLQADLVRFMPFDTVIGIVVVVAFAGWQAWQALQEERARASDLERQLAVARLEALQMQLHPHFLFNTLHTIAGLAVEDPATARRMVIALGDLLRSTLKRSGDMRTLAEELEYSDLYLGIEKLRLGDRLVLNYDIDPSATRALVPQLILQPLFENAIRHGASRMTAPCEIRFSACRKPGTLQIVIRNDGPQSPPPCSESRFGVGLTNTMNRLRIHYGNRHTFRFSVRAEGGGQLEMSIPYCDSAAKDTITPAVATGR